MTAATVTERPSEILRSGSDFASSATYRYPTDAQIVAGLAQAAGLSADDLRDGRRMRRINHVAQMIQLYYRQARATGDREGFKKRAAVAAALWPDVEGTHDVRRKWKQMHQWEVLAEAGGFLRVSDGRGARALHWELLDDWQRYAETSRGYSSAGKAPSDCEARRRRETRQERHARRVRPHCRRVGNSNGSVGRLLAPEAPPFSSEEKSVLRVVRSPKGDLTTEALAVRGHEPGAGHDAAQRRDSADRSAALDWEERRLERLVAAEAAFVADFGPPAGGPMLLAGPLIDALELFDRRYAELAELNGWRPAPEPPASLSFLRQLMGAELDAMQWGERQAPPRHLGYFVKPLLAEARRNERRARERRAMAATGSRRPPRRGSDARRI